jgi:DNA-binding NarL/FixJ family response regulator
MSFDATVIDQASSAPAVTATEAQVVATGAMAATIVATLQAGGITVETVVEDSIHLPPAETYAGAAVSICALPGAAVARMEAIRAMRPADRIVLIAPPMHRMEVLRALEAGADGVVVDAMVAETLCATVRAVAAGQLAFPRSVRHQVRKPVLSVREKQVLGMVVIGFSNSEVAAKLFLAESTVKSHLTSAFGKLGVRSRKEAAAMILDPENGLGTGILSITETDQRSPNHARVPRA